MMKKNFSVIISFLTIFCLGILIFRPAYSQDASLLPNAVQQFFDASGNPLSSGKVYFYEVGTTTFKDTYTSSAATTPYQNPITLNAGGKPPGSSGIYGIGLYRQLVKDKNGNTIWDAVTAPGGGGGGTPTNVGDGNLVGTIIPWSGLIAPNQYVFAYGQELARATFPEFFTAVTQQANVICSASSNILTGISDTTQITIGRPVELSLCVANGTTVVSKTASSVTLSNSSNVSINAVATFFPYGNGNGNTTFNVPDLRGYTIAGRDNMGGSAAGRLTSTYFNAPGQGAVGGNQSFAITTQAQLPNFSLNLSSLTVSSSGTALATTGQVVTNTGSFSPAQSGSGLSNVPSGAVNSSVNVTTTGTVGGSLTLGGSSAAFSIVQPTITLNYIIKVTPDTSTSIATGVYSIGGMGGVIACGTGILCTGNIISFNGNVIAKGSTGSLQYKNSDGSFGGSPNAIFISPNNLTLGSAGASFLFDILGSTSGRIRQTVPAVAGTTDIVWGNTSGTPAVTSSLPIVLNTTTGNLTCPTCATSTLNTAALTKTNDTNITLTLGGSPTTALLNAASLTLGWTGTLAAGRLNSNVVQAITNDTNITGSITAQNLTLGWTGLLGLNRGGTNASLVASNGGIVYSTSSAMAILGGTATANLPLLSGVSSAPTWGTVSHPISAVSGGIPYFSSTSIMATSALLATNQIMIGGGAGAAPTTFVCSTSTTLVHGGTPPTCSQVVAADIATNTITNSNLAQASARTIKGNPTGSTANIQDVVNTTARTSSLLNIDQLTTNGDSNYSVLNTDRSVFTSATLTAPRTWTLPAANTVNAGQEITIWDAAGGVISPNNLTVARTGSDTINGSTAATINTQFGGLTLKSDGVSKYTYVPVTSGGGSGTVTSITCNGGTTTITVSGTCASRELVSSNRIYYVRSDGNNSCDGLTNAAGASGACAFLTLQKCIDTISTLDRSTFAVDCQFGTTSSFAGATVNGPFVGGAGSSTSIIGNVAAAGSYVITSVLTANNGANFRVRGVKFASSGNGLRAANGSTIAVDGVSEFGACTSNHMVAERNSRIIVSANYTINGNTSNHIVSQYGSYIFAAGLTVTLTGTPTGIPAFSSNFANAETTGTTQLNGNTYSGSATGPRYSATGNGVINTLGGGATYLPGGTAGSTSTGGQYL